MVLCVFVNSCRRFVIASFPHQQFIARTLDYPEDGINAMSTAVHRPATWQRVLENAYLQCRCEWLEFRAM
jgi:penicillin V acylase-like amidase (Ntn superfamily)